MKHNNRRTVIRQIGRPLGISLFVLILLAMTAMFMFSIQQTFIERRDNGQQIAEYITYAVTDYEAIGWLVDYWQEHTDDIELIYDDTEMKDLRDHLDRNIDEFITAKDLTTDIVTNLSDELKHKFAEYCYAELSSEFNWVKRMFEPAYLDAFVIRDDKRIFLISGAGWGETHISEGGQIYDLGFTTPFERGAYPVLDKMLEEELPQNSIEVSLSADADRSKVHTFAPVYDKDGKMAMIVAVSQEWKDLIVQTLRITVITSFIMIVLFIIFNAQMMRLLRKVVVRPIQKEENVLAEYISDKDSVKAVRSLSEIRPDNEIQTLAENFSFMAAEIDRYVNEIKTAAAEKERIGAELDMASRIQESQLPREFPAFPGRSEFDIFASMTPAKEVGGDFYDLFLTDEDHLVLLIADVSGKGVPAALFMMAAKILINNYAAFEKTPSAILMGVNERICEHGADDMFVTVWLGILEISTGKLTCCSAGHEYPAIKKAGGSFELLKDKHGVPVGTMPRAKYRDYEIQLAPGDTVFVYTDGVPEATDADSEMFGTDRMIKALNDVSDGTVGELLKGVKQKVDEFVGEAPQFDDLTMLSVRYLGKG